MSNIIPIHSKKLATKDVIDGERFLNTLSPLVGWPRRFSAEQDRQTSKQHKKNIIEVREHYLSLLQPSEATYILGKIEILESRYYQRDTNPTVQDEIDKEWIDDLSEYPADLIELACNNWRRSNNNYAPRSAGVLMESVKSEYVRRVVMYRKAKTVLEITNVD